MSGGITSFNCLLLLSIGVLMSMNTNDFITYSCNDATKNQIPDEYNKPVGSNSSRIGVTFSIYVMFFMVLSLIINHIKKRTNVGLSSAIISYIFVITAYVLLVVSSNSYLGLVEDYCKENENDVESRINRNNNQRFIVGAIVGIIFILFIFMAKSKTN